ncbi:aryl-alcohol-oxidase from pleurotus Eryingii [Crucibulum laeve]|uniref:pyranose dehydrogenase (acceptor) n=1 Tax=Crucibulum laeve TaxID=68775 RepID=A0A5C3LST4_9AGAR|nr:aryl-alcohol-oxidase from pleurotus Eryingii [Crucibulum laeve]
MLSFILSLWISATFFVSCYGAIHQSFNDLPPGSSFDFIVVGGGTAGCVIASRLSENPRFNVLVIESGPSNEGVLDAQVPFLEPGLILSPFDWNFTTVPQTSANGKSMLYPRGHILGGSSSINAMFYTRGSSSDFDRFARVTGDSGWSWGEMLPYILKNEKWVPPADNHPTAGQFNPAFHSLTGMTSVSLPGFPQGTDGRVIQTTKDLKDEFPFNVDMNSGNPLGVGWLQGSIGNGERSSAATSYLTSQVVARPNLQIVLNTQVTRVLETGGKSPSIRKVELTTGSKLTTVTAAKEVILSAGSINTPHLLLNSGIGDKNELAKKGIASVLNLPSVGKNLTDQVLVSATWFANSNNTIDSINANKTLFTQLLDEWQKTRMGPMTNAGVNQIAWVRMPDNSPIFETFADPSSGSNSPHIELALSNGGGLGAGVGHFVGAGVAVVTPMSRGSVTLNTTNPFDQPLIDLGLLTSNFDILALKAGVASARRFFAGPAWKGYVLQPAGAFANATTDQLLHDYIVANAFSTSHPVGTASMSAKTANFGVVNPDLKVKGADGIRIVDASVMPFIPCGHTQAPVYAIAERAADLIKADWQ